MENKDKNKADSLESPYMKATLKKEIGTTSYYNGCQQQRIYCSTILSKSGLAKATQAYEEYTTSNGQKGKELVETFLESTGGTQSTGQSCSSKSTNTLVIAVVPSGNSWLVDNVFESSHASSCADTTLQSP